MDAEKRDALETIISNSEWLRDRAKRNGHGFLAYLLGLVLHEARATLIGHGQRSLSGERPAAKVLSFRPHKSRGPG